MKILYDFQTFAMHRFGGISRYFYELISKGGKNKYYEPEVSVKYHINIYLNAIQQSASYPWRCEKSLRGISFPGKGIFCKIYNSIVAPVDPWIDNQMKVIADLNSNNYDVFHPTYYDNYFVNKVEKIPLVLTVYDMIHELFQYADSSKFIQQKKKLIFLADHIIAISEQTKKDILTFYNIPESKISVIYLANSLGEKYINNENIQPVLPSDFVLFVGNRGGYKNFNFFLGAMSEILGERPELCVVCTGKPFTDEEKKWINEQNLPAKRIIAYPSSEYDLPLLYKNAKCFVFPSLYEGFGLPVLEAFSCGCPTALSTGGALPEVGGDAALYFDPKSVTDIKGIIERLLDNHDLRRKYIKKGYERATVFSWDKTVKDTGEVYKKVLS